MSVPVTPEQYFKYCKNHDWYYAMSDDHRVWTAGQQANATLVCYYLGNPALLPIYKAWESHAYSGKPWGTEPLPEPRWENGALVLDKKE